MALKDFILDAEGYRKQNEFLKLMGYTRHCSGFGCSRREEVGYSLCALCIRRATTRPIARDALTPREAVRSHLARQAPVVRMFCHVGRTISWPFRRPE